MSLVSLKEFGSSMHPVWGPVVLILIVWYVPGTFFYTFGHMGFDDGFNFGVNFDDVLAKGQGFFTGPGSTHFEKFVYYQEDLPAMSMHTMAGALLLTLGSIQVLGKRRGITHRYIGWVFALCHAVNLFGSLFVLSKRSWDGPWDGSGILTGPVFAFLLWAYWLGATLFLTLGIYFGATRQFAAHSLCIFTDYCLVMGAPMLRLFWIVFSYILPGYSESEVNASSITTVVLVTTVLVPGFMMTSKDPIVRARTLDLQAPSSRVVQLAIGLSLVSTFIVWWQMQMRGAGVGGILRSTEAEETYYRKVFEESSSFYSFACFVFLVGCFGMGVAGPLLMWKELRQQTRNVLAKLYLGFTLVGTLGVLLSVDVLTYMVKPPVPKRIWIGVEATFWILTTLKCLVFAGLYEHFRLHPREGQPAWEFLLHSLVSSPATKIVFVATWGIVTACGVPLEDAFVVGIYTDMLIQLLGPALVYLALLHPRLPWSAREKEQHEPLVDTQPEDQGK